MLAAQVTGDGLGPFPRGHYTLASVAEQELGVTLDKTEQHSDWASPLSDEQLAYAARDAAILLPLMESLQAKLTAADLEAVAALEMRSLPAVAWLEQSGAPFDIDAWRVLSDTAVAEQIRLEQELSALGGGINWSSPPQVLKLLRERGHDLKNTDEAALQAIANDEPIAALLLEYREASRKASTYGIEFAAKHVHPLTRRIHGNYLQLGAESGRMACRNPNLQNIPRDPAYRACFRPPEGRVLMKADYSQIELRIAAVTACRSSPTW
jgi:DNA polymerase I